MAFVSPCAATSTTHASAVKYAGQLRRIGGGRDDVEVAEGLLAPAHRPRLGNVDRSRVLAQDGDNRLDGRQAVSEQAPSRVGVLRLKGERLQDLLLALRAEAGKRPQALGLGGRLQLLERRDAELLPDARRGLRPESRQPHEQHDFGRNRRLPLRKRLDLSLLDDLNDLLLDRLADSLQLLRPSVEGELRDRPRRLAHPSRRTAVCEHAERLRPFELEQVCEQVELLGHVGVRGEHGHGAILCTRSAD